MRTTGSKALYNCKKNPPNNSQTVPKRWTQGARKPPKEDKEISSGSPRNRPVRGDATRTDALLHLGLHKRMRESCRGVKEHGNGQRVGVPSITHGFEERG